MATLYTNNDLQVVNSVQLQSSDSEYVKLVSHIATLWDNARKKNYRSKLRVARC